MMFIKDNNTKNAKNQKLIQFVTALKKIGSSDENFKQIFQKLGDVNIKVTPTNYLNIRNPHSIGNTALHLAYNTTCKNHLSLVLNQGTDFTIKNQDNLTVLHLVLRYQNSDDFRFLSLRSPLENDCVDLILSAHLKTKNFANPCDSNGMSHFHIACMANNVEAVNFFLDNGVFIDHAVNSDSPYFAGFTALHLAIRCYCIQVIKVLLDHGANIFLKNAKGETATHMVMGNYFKLAEDFLLGYFSKSDQLKTNVNEEVARLLLGMVSDNMVMDESGLSCLHLACTMTDSSTAKKLLRRGDINQKIKIESPLWPGCTALHFAAHANVNTVKMLLAKGADLTIEDANGKTPLDLCMRTYKIDFDIHNILASSPIYREITFTQGISLLNLILATRHYEQFQSLLSRYYNSASIKIPLDAPLWAGFTPLHLLIVLFSIGNDYYEQPYLTSEKMSSTLNDIDYSNREKEKAFALKKQYWLIIKDLLDKNARIVTARDAHGRTPLHLSFYLNTVEYVVDLLLKVHDKFSFPCDYVNDEGLSLLHIACTRSNKNFVEKLLASSNNVGLAYKGKAIRNLVKTGWTPLDVARASSQFEIVELLLKHGAEVQRTKSETSYNSLQREDVMFVRDSKGMPYVLKYIDSYFEELKENENLQQRAETEIGLTKVHVACFSGNSEWLRNLVHDGANINAQLSLDLPECAGFTPLHVVVGNKFDWRYCSDRYPENKNELMKILLDAGADVTLSDAKQSTPLHNIDSNLWLCGNDEKLVLAVMMLKAQKDFSINPTDEQEISHFHIACKLGVTAVVKKYLERGNLDVNQPTDFFLFSFAGFTPLHMAAISDTFGVGISSHLQTVDLLLKHGADPHCQSSRGNTALHVAKRYEIFEKISRAGADVNLVNAEGNTPLGFLLTEHYCCAIGFVPSADHILNWLRCGCNYNAFDAFTGIGYIRKTIDVIPFEKLQNLIEIAVVNMPNAMQADEMGRTAIHNVVTDYNHYSSEKISTIQYAWLIETLASSGCDVDSPDNLGRTPLHVAARFRNCAGIRALLMVGADVNIRDKNGETVLNYHIRRCKRLKGCYDEERSEWCSVFKALAVHVRKLQICRLEVCPANRSHVTDKFVSTMDDELFHCELEEIKIMKIEPYQLTLGDFLSETNAVYNYPTMSQPKKDAINDFFSQEKVSSFREKFGEVAGLLVLQYRKAIMRASLIEEAVSSLNFLAKFPVPQLCSRIIFGFLSNTDLINFIASTKNCKDDGRGHKMDIPRGSLLENKKLRIE